MEDKPVGIKELKRLHASLLAGVNKVNGAISAANALGVYVKLAYIDDRELVVLRADVPIGRLVVVDEE